MDVGIIFNPTNKVDKVTDDAYLSSVISAIPLRMERMANREKRKVCTYILITNTLTLSLYKLYGCCIYYVQS